MVINSDVQFHGFKELFSDKSKSIEYGVKFMNKVNDKMSYSIDDFICFD